MGNPTKRCKLCLNEKLAIALNKEGNMLKKRTEIIIKCRQYKIQLSKLSHQISNKVWLIVWE